MAEARDAFLAALERYTLADLIEPRRKLAVLLTRSRGRYEPGVKIPEKNMSAVSEEDRLRRARLPAVLDYAFRPMFLAAGSWAVIALALWLAMFFGYVQLPTRFDPLAWHVHEMLFGFVMAAVAGFLLTAIPNWTGRLPVRGYPLAVLAGLWLLGRLPA